MCETLLEDPRTTDFSLSFYTAYKLKTTAEDVTEPRPLGSVDVPSLEERL